MLGLPRGRRGSLMNSESILVWNVRGLNANSHRDALRSLVGSERVSVVCVQETKLHVIDNFLVMQVLGIGFDYSFLSSVGTRGGILVAWRASSWSASSISTQRYSVLVRLKPIAGGEE
jgi:exonuclease III